jgi:hypothetical protein
MVLRSIRSFAVYDTGEEIGRVGLYACGIELGGKTCIYINRLTVYRDWAISSHGTIHSKAQRTQMLRIRVKV